ncbi:MAG: FtsX-like permease family protein [Bacteroidota bacterium]|nr:FtsX-like permease family protein [Bacteroidota bacterium]
MLKTAWKFIRYDKAKSIGITVGIVISTFLIGQQIGIFLFLTGAMKALATNVKADIWVTDSKTRDVNQLGKMDISTLRNVQSLPGVALAFPILVTGGAANFQNGTSGNITLIGVDINQLSSVLDSSKIAAGKVSDLELDGAVSGELFEKSNLGDNVNIGTPFEIDGKRAFFALQTRGFRGFGSSFCITTLERARYFSNQSSDNISAVLVRVTPGTNVDSVASLINRTIYGVRAWPSEKLAASTVQKILSSSGIALSTGTLIIFALIAGFFIIGLTMYSSALDRLKDYGTLKAIGAGNGFIRRLILTQAILFAVTGFVIAYLFLEGFRQGVASSGLIFSFSPLQILGIFLIINLISMGGASFALKRISGVEPASVFR